MEEYSITFTTDGSAELLHHEAVDLEAIGEITEVSRASNVEFDAASGRWRVELPAGGVLFSHKSRARCLAWERGNEEPLRRNAKRARALRQPRHHINSSHPRPGEGREEPSNNKRVQ